MEAAMAIVVASPNLILFSSKDVKGSPSAGSSRFPCTLEWRRQCRRHEEGRSHDGSRKIEDRGKEPNR